jgi:glycosyltransferase involved in cell wall biosynthesis
LKVLIIPRWLGNPYLEVLAASLQAAGLTVRMPPFYPVLPLWSAVAVFGKPDVIHLHWPHPYFVSDKPAGWLRGRLRTIEFFAQIIALRWLGVRVVWTIHNIVNHDQVQAKWEMGACKLMSRFADEMIVHCTAAAPIVAEAYGVPVDRLVVVPHGHYAESELYPQPIPKREARDVLGLPRDEKILLFFGAVRRYKGLDKLLETFGSVVADRCRLILLGKPTPVKLADSLAALAQRDPRTRTRFEYVDKQLLAQYIDACDVVVLPYLDSLTSGAAVLAASRRRSVLQPRLGCMQEFPEDAVFHYEVDDPDGLRKALEWAIHTEQTEMEAMGRKAYKYVEEYPWSHVARETVRVYELAMAQRDKTDG